MNIMGSKTIKKSRIILGYKDRGGFMHIYRIKRFWQKRVAFSKLFATS